MFSRKKSEPAKRRNHNLSQFGLTDIPDDFDPSLGFDGGDHDANDSDLEAELAAIAGGGNKTKPKPKQKPNLLPANELDKMIADSLKDIGSDDEDDEDTENDTDLLGELQGIVGEDLEDGNVEEDPTETSPMEPESKPEIFLPTTDISTVDIIKQRIEMYKIAEANAKAAGESAKMRRFNRGLKTLNDLLRQANSGKAINPDDIPPEVSVKPAANSNSGSDSNPTPVVEEPPKVPTRQAPLPPAQSQEETKPNENDIAPQTSQIHPLVQQMRSRQQEYKAAALQSKRAGDTAMALQFLKVVKQFDVVVKMCEDGQEVDLSDMPPPPEQFKEFMEKMQAASEQPADPLPMSPAAPVTESVSVVEPSLSTATNMLEALQQRLAKYKSVEESAKAEGNASKARRFGRIVKQYEDAIKAYKAGRPVAYDELPVPPGFGPLPVENAAAPPTPKVDSVPPSPPTVSTTASTPEPSPTATAKKPSTPPQHIDLTTRTSGNQQKNNLAEHQMKILLERQKEFKLAAIEAKKAGEIDQAKEYLKIYKGFDALLNAASSGLPVDLNTLPVPPSQRDNLEASFAIITTDECDPDDDISDIGIRIEEQLAKQLMMCKNTRDHHKAMGDIAGMNRFENLALTVQKDLDLVRYSKRKNFPLPKFHYEKRSFNIVHCNTDLTDNELEIIVVRGINYNVPNPKEVDTYVKIEFPLLNDETFKTKTNLIKDTDSPDYDQHFKVDIMRGNRQFQRIFKRHGVKFEVYSRGCSLYCCGLSRILPICCFRGFLRSDTLIGTVNVKLQPLETKCDIHDTFDLVEGRKKVGGKLEIKLRVRNPILTKQMEHINEKWLVIDT
ncbi:coiled-coil and C2 domain-containing protein 1-like isoform X1 [Lucilia sericata]|uniref:coiled-coil and C2 domain-containing protein 1-like isoform X1 n=1 Tax=Lucilia sericata TaxID=13632 RepID=UPI0018A82FA4|nr:coiled-coil and C2 domain-containing protein 1-like isoform X1 [Lucilia sericata]XP_037810903.1 coiled-coil and C2 domain-containing protein 1-like isoform X1 [Lucilia sericata]XP_037810911.1 coiled-coil and C2 domain-containing protein 1-like isoform X1 [Lucilia sericata]XP_037810921.1 coiled-coil and C2 domain-containing protein 1-like isoform X1 [Lucilia sericata]XP_037810929.1 coiled-coil and C2 domain-containing protein 1-like isoform X1 [Lucilia sericata]XP_037810935.1 coiled-coil and